MIRLTLISALLLATLASCDDIPKQQSILPLPAITSLSQWNTEVLSTRSTAIVVLSLSSESNYDTMITDKCNSLNAQFSASSLPDALPFTCFTLDCSSSDQHKKICKPFLQTVPSIPAIVAFTGEPVLNPYQPADKAMGRPLVAAFNGVTDSPSEVERWLKRMLPNYVTLVDDSGEAGLSPTDKTHHEVIEVSKGRARGEQGASKGVVNCSPDASLLHSTAFTRYYPLPPPARPLLCERRLLPL